MATHMKTTIDMTDALFVSAKQLAQKRGTTLRALVEEGMRRVLADAQASVKPAFKLRDASVGGGQVLIADGAAWLQLSRSDANERLAALPVPAQKSPEHPVGGAGPA